MPTISTSLTPFSLKFRTPISSPGISCSKLTHIVTVTVTVTLLFHHNNASLFTISCATVSGFSWTAILSLSSSKLVPISHFPTKVKSFTPSRSNSVSNTMSSSKTLCFPCTRFVACFTMLAKSSMKYHSLFVMWCLGTVWFLGVYKDVVIGIP